LYLNLQISQNKKVNKELSMKPGASGSPYNSSFSGGRDQENCGSKPAWANSSRDLILKKPSQKRDDGMAQGVGPEFKPQYHKKVLTMVVHTCNPSTLDTEAGGFQVQSQSGVLSETLSQ
jgi:hypothetical protein